MRLLCMCALAALSLAGAEPGFTPLFDGKTLNGWKLVRGRGPGYIVEHGVLVCPEEGGGNLFTEKEYANFVLRLEYKMVDGTNNGVGIRAPLEGDAAYAGMEIQLLDDDADRYKGRLQPWQYNGSVYNVVPAKQCCRKPDGQWNQEEITADGSHIVVKLNGSAIVDADLAKVTDPEILKKHPGIRRTQGHIGFLGHGTRIELRNIRIKELPPPAKR
jgi:hypothetical protein